MKPRLLINCDAKHSTFKLSKEGAGCWKYFLELAAALDHAAKSVIEETPITIYNAAGGVLLETVIWPKPAE